MKKLFSAIILSFIVQSAIAQSARVPIQTDRPDQTESPSTVPPGYWQMEMGILFQGDEINVNGMSQKNNSLVSPTLLTKYGVTKKFELRLITELGTNQNIIGNVTQSTTGIKPVIVGMKMNLLQESKSHWRPKTSLIVHMGLNALASKDFQTTNPFPQFRFLMQHSLTDRLSLGYNLGGEWNGFDNRMTTIYTLTLAESLTKRLGVFIELYGFMDGYKYFSANQGHDHRFDAGFTYLAEKNVQFDISGGFGITDISPDYFLSGGISFRLPK